MSENKKKKNEKKRGLDVIWLSILPVLLVLSILLALMLWSETENTFSKWFGEDILRQIRPDEVFDILEGDK